MQISIISTGHMGKQYRPAMRPRAATLVEFDYDAKAVAFGQAQPVPSKFESLVAKLRPPRLDAGIAVRQDEDFHHVSETLAGGDTVIDGGK